MNLYILNEKDYIREILASGIKPDDLSIKYLITLTAKYYFDKTDTPDELIDIIKSKMLEFNIPGYQEYKYYNKIKKIVVDLFESDTSILFRELPYIPIYEQEIHIINSLPNDRQKKFMFTLYAIARYMDNHGWINKKDIRGLSEVFKLANVTLTNNKKMEMLHELYSNGYIKFTKKVDNLNIQVELNEFDDSEIAYKIKEFKNIGNQYIGNFKKGYKQCSICGKKIKMTTPNRVYCNNCAKEQDKKKAKNRMKVLRNS